MNARPPLFTPHTPPTTQAQYPTFLTQTYTKQVVPSLPLAPDQLKEGDRGHGGYARAYAFFSEAHLTSSVEIVWLGARHRVFFAPPVATSFLPDDFEEGLMRALERSLVTADADALGVLGKYGLTCEVRPNYCPSKRPNLAAAHMQHKSLLSICRLLHRCPRLVTYAIAPQITLFQHAIDRNGGRERLDASRVVGTFAFRVNPAELVAREVESGQDPIDLEGICNCDHSLLGYPVVAETALRESVRTCGQKMAMGKECVINAVFAGRDHG